jgi:hypothetical protein
MTAIPRQRLNCETGGVLANFGPDRRLSMVWRRADTALAPHPAAQRRAGGGGADLVWKGGEER